MKKVTIEPGCTSCGLCEFIAPEVFQVTDISRVLANAPIEACVPRIQEAAQGCPVQVITIQQD